MNNYYYYPPVDSKGRRIGLANGFGDYSDAMLISMKHDLSLSMSDAALRFLRDYHKNNKLNAIRLDELYLLDEIALSSVSFTENSAVYDFFTESGELAECYKDAMEKYKATSGENAPAPTLRKLADIGGLYAKSIGLKPIERNTDNSTANGDRYLLLYQKNTEDSFEQKISELFGCNEFRQNTSFYKLIDNRGIAFALASCADGIYADLYSLPQTASSPELSDLATEYRGCYIVACRREAIDNVCSIAESFGIGCVYFARSYPSSKFTLRTVGRTSMELDTALIRIIGGGVFGKAFDAYTDEYFKAQTELVSALIPAIASGAPVSDITLSPRYVFPLYAEDSKTLGKCISAILGVYRGQIELCMPSDEPIIDYQNNTSVSVYLDFKSSHSFSNNITEKYDGAYLSLFSFEKKENGTPDYASLRGMCKKVNSLISSKNTVYSLPVVSSLSDAILKVSDSFDIIPNESLPAIDYNNVTGVILILKEPDPMAITLGKVVSRRKAEETPTEETDIEN